MKVSTQSMAATSGRGPLNASRSSHSPGMRHLQPAGDQPWSAVRSSHRLNRSSIASLHPAARVCC